VTKKTQKNIISLHFKTIHVQLMN